MNEQEIDGKFDQKVEERTIRTISSQPKEREDDHRCDSNEYNIRSPAH